MGGKNKLKRFAEFASYNITYEPYTKDLLENDFELKGSWHAESFKNSNPIVLELGCGKGEYTVGLAQRYPNCNFIGIDIKGNRMHKGAKHAMEENLQNVRFLRTRIEQIASCFGANEVSEIWITFSDPQPQQSRERKRLTSAQFIARYLQFLKPGGLIHVKHDDPTFFEFSLQQFKAHNFTTQFVTHNLYGTLEQLDETTKDILSIRTFYESMWIAKGKNIHYARVQIPG